LIPLLLVMVGGALGSALRYAVGLALPGITSGFPWATLAVNLVGSFAIGWVAAQVQQGQLGENARLLLAVGLLGGFTTFSSFSLEALLLLQQGRLPAALLYISSSLLLGILGTVAAFGLYRLLRG
jgi:CrcB protein